MKSVKYLDAVMKAHGLKTDAELCRFMGWSHSAANNYRKGISFMNNEACLAVARALDMQDPLPIIMAADLDRAERAGQKSLWEVFSARMAHSTAVAVLAVGVAAMATSGKSVARPAGIEPATPAFGGQYSIH